MRFFKKNQIIIYVIALMLVTAGYLNYTSLNDKEQSKETSTIAEINTKTEKNEIDSNTNNSINEIANNTQIADIGDATLVNSNDVVGEDNKTLETTVQTSSTNNNDYFTKSKLERESMYSQMLETYEKILNSTNSLEIQKQSASEKITQINNTKNSIMICENLIKTKGFENNIIFVNGESISVIIGTQELKQEEIAKIQNIISRELKAEVANIHISTK